MQGKHSCATCARELDTNVSGCALLQQANGREPAGVSIKGDDVMAEQFVNPQEQKVQDETDTSKSTDKKLDRIAEKAAEKAGKTQQKNEKDQPIFTE
jgi:hypothetical protein